MDLIMTSRTRSNKQQTGVRTRRDLNNISQIELDKKVLKHVRAHKVLWKPSPKSVGTDGRAKVAAWKAVSAKSGETVDDCKARFDKIKKKVTYRIRLAIKNNATTWSEVNNFVKACRNSWPSWNLVGWLAEQMTGEAFSIQQASFGIMELASEPELAEPNVESLSGLGLSAVQRDGLIQEGAATQCFVDDVSGGVPQANNEVIISPPPYDISGLNGDASSFGIRLGKQSQRKRTPAKVASGQGCRRRTKPSKKANKKCETSFNISTTATDVLPTMIDIKRETDETDDFLNEGPPLADNNINGMPSTSRTVGASFPTFMNGPMFFNDYQFVFSPNPAENNDHFRSGMRSVIMYYIESDFLSRHVKYPSALARETYNEMLRYAQKLSSSEEM